MKKITVVLLLLFVVIFARSVWAVTTISDYRLAVNNLISNYSLFDLNTLISNYGRSSSLDSPSAVTATAVLNAREQISCSQLCVNRGYTGCASIGTNAQADNTKFAAPIGPTCGIYSGYGCDMRMESGWPLLDCPSGEPNDNVYHPSHWTNCLCYTGVFPTPIPTPTPTPPSYGLPSPHYDTHIVINEGYGTCETLCRDLGYVGNGSQSCSTFGLDTNATNGHECESNMYNTCEDFDETTYGYGANCSYFSMAPYAYGPNNCGGVCGTDRYGQTHNTMWTQCNCILPTLQLSAPTNLVLSQNNVIITARWDAVTNATGYQVWSNTSPSSTGATLVGYTSNPYYTLTATSTRYYSVRATFKSLLYSGYSTWLQPTVIPNPTPIVDTTPPTVSITSPTNNQTVTGTVNILAAASDDVGVTRVEFFVDSVLKCTTTSSYSCSWNTTTETNSSHSLTAKAYDAASHVTTSSTISVTVNNYAAGSNLGFELGNLTGWSTGGLQVVSNIKHSGNYSGKAVASGTSMVTFTNAIDSLFSITPGQGYVLSYWYNVTEAGSQGAAWTCKAYYRDASKNAILYESCGVNNTPVTNGWVNKIVNLGGHPNARYLEIWFEQIWDRAGGNANVYFDDFSIN